MTFTARDALAIGVPLKENKKKPGKHLCAYFYFSATRRFLAPVLSITLPDAPRGEGFLSIQRAREKRHTPSEEHLLRATSLFLTFSLYLFLLCAHQLSAHPVQTHTHARTLLYAIAAAPHQRGTLYTHRHTRAHPLACRKSGKSWQIFFSLSRCGAKGLFYSLAKKERLLDEIEFKSRNS